MKYSNAACAPMALTMLNNKTVLVYKKVSGQAEGEAIAYTILDDDKNMIGEIGMMIPDREFKQEYPTEALSAMGADIYFCQDDLDSFLADKNVPYIWIDSFKKEDNAEKGIMTACLYEILKNCAYTVYCAPCSYGDDTVNEKLIQYYKTNFDFKQEGNFLWLKK